MKPISMTLSIVFPCYNEGEIIAATVRDAYSWMTKASVKGEIIVVNDGSSDNTASVLSALRQEVPTLVVVTHPHNRGYGAAIHTGCDNAKMDLIAFVDSDGQFHVSELEKFFPFFPAVDVVSGIRLKRADPFIRWLNSNLFRVFINAVLGLRMTDLDCGMKAFKREVWKKIVPVYATGAFFDAELFFNTKKNGLRLAEVPVHHFPRTSGHSTGAKLKVIVKAFRDLFRLLSHDGNIRHAVYPVLRAVR